MLGVLVIIYNVVFGVIGAGLLVAGIIINSQLDVAKEYLGDLASTLVFMLIGIGSVIIVLSLLGCLGACLASCWILIAVAILLLMLAIAKLFTGIIALTGNDKDLIQGDKMDRAVKTYRASSEAREKLDMIQERFFCCGSNNYEDYSPDYLPESCCKESAGNSDKESTGNSDNGSTGNTGKEKPGDSILKRNLDGKYSDGYRRSGKKEDHYLIGCKEALSNFIRKIKLCIGGVILGFIIVEVIGFICALLLAINLFKQRGDDYDQYSE